MGRSARAQAARHGATVPNSSGTLDASLRGEVQVPLITHGLAPFEIARGDRIAQLIIAAYLPVRFLLAAALGTTARGASGFSSMRRA